MDAYRFPVDHAKRDGAADNGSIAVTERCANERRSIGPGAVEYRRVATRDYAGGDGSTGYFTAH
jgi:hypothetical protein